MTIKPKIKKELYVPGLFFHFGTASLAKSVVFRSISSITLSQKERIVSVITGYYSLFNMTIALMYFCPQMLQVAQKEKLVKSIQNRVDPMKDDISHSTAGNFLVQCQARNLSYKCVEVFNKGRKMREFVNYAPRTKTTGIDAIFESCEYEISDVDLFAQEVDEFIFETISWGLENSPDSSHLLRIALFHRISDFIDRPEFLYKLWTSSQVSCEARIFIYKLQELSNKVQLAS